MLKTASLFVTYSSRTSMQYIHIGQFVAMVTHGLRNASLKIFAYLHVFSIPDWEKLVFEYVFACVYVMYVRYAND